MFGNLDRPCQSDAKVRSLGRTQSVKSEPFGQPLVSVPVDKSLKVGAERQVIDWVAAVERTGAILELHAELTPSI